jgi:hypothetical protein
MTQWFYGTQKNHKKERKTIGEWLLSERKTPLPALREGAFV